MSDEIRSSNEAAVKDPSGPTGTRGGKSDVKTGTAFVQSSVFALLPDSDALEAKSYGPWVMVSNAEAEEVEQKLTASGWLFSTGTFIETSAFGCDSKVLERAVSRALEKAADAELDSLEITGVTVHHDSGLDYASVLARARTIRRDLTGGPVDNGINSTASQIKDQESLAV